MKRLVKIIFIALVLLLCSTPLALTVIGIDSPSVEKKSQASAPRMILADGSLNESFTRDLDLYIADNFPMRTLLISAWHFLNTRILGQTGNDQVILGRDGWLFYAPTIAAYTASDRFSQTEYDRLDTILRLQRDYLASRGISFIYTVVPNKNSVYPEKMPIRYENLTDDNNLAGLHKHLQTPGYLDLHSLLTRSATQQEALLYHQTDSHWNNSGALIALSALLNQASQQLGNPLANPYLKAASHEVADWSGDLAVMLYPVGPRPDRQQYYDVDPGYRYTRPLRSLEDLSIITRGSGQGSVLMFRDSFANALIPMLSESFAEVTYSRAVPYDYVLLDKTDTDLVILEIVERNLPDWLTNPPRLPAVEYSGDLPSAQPGGTGKISIDRQEEAGWIKINGKIADSTVLSNWHQLLINIDGKIYEALPVTDRDQPDLVSFTLYLTNGSQPDTVSISEVLVSTDHGWFSFDSD
ncbi:MAG TPA: hypothetical protein DCM45_04850 [Clostridiales bacterium]|nr:hypothetical protein [Clostridiales bacterium]